jgi:hypothetical protein
MCCGMKYCDVVRKLNDTDEVCSSSLAGLVAKLESCSQSRAMRRKHTASDDPSTSSEQVGSIFPQQTRFLTDT